MFYIYTPSVTPSGKRVSNTKIILFEATNSGQGTLQYRYTTQRRFELTRKGRKTTKENRYVHCSRLNDIADASTAHLDGYMLCFSSFDQAYLAKCTLINRIPEVFLAKILALTEKMNSLESANPQPQFMSDAIPEVFV